jgi:hypothetical protein
MVLHKHVIARGLLHSEQGLGRRRYARGLFFRARRPSFFFKKDDDAPGEIVVIADADAVTDAG